MQRLEGDDRRLAIVDAQVQRSGRFPPMISRIAMQTGRTVLIAGGGIAGLILATRLGHSLGRSGKARIVLVDRSPTHAWKPMLRTFAAGTWRAPQQQLLYLDRQSVVWGQSVSVRVDLGGRRALQKKPQ